MSVTVDISGIEELERELEKYGDEANEQVADAANEAVINVDRVAKRNAPVDTGRLRSSIHPVFTNTTDTETEIVTGPLDAAVTTNVTYAPFMEFGTVHIDPRPYMFPAWESERPKYIDRVKRVLRSL